MVAHLRVAEEPVGPSSLGARLGQDLDRAFPELVADFETAVYTTALRLSGKADQAEDLAAETFLRAFAALRRYPPERIADLQLRPWLITICLNQWRNQLRLASRRPAQSGSDGGPPPEPPSAGESPEDRAMRHEQGDHLAIWLQQLPERQRIAVVLRHVVQLSYAEVALTLGCPEGTAKSHVSRGLDRLRALSTQYLSTHQPEALP